MEIRVGVLTISTRGSRGERPDESGPTIESLVRERLGAQIAQAHMLPDSQTDIQAILAQWADGGAIDLILTTGGTGFAPSDVTPEATRRVIDREAPGLAEAMRLVNPLGRLSRGVAGTIGTALVLNVPGSPKGAVECLAAVVDVVPHALALLTGARPH